MPQDQPRQPDERTSGCQLFEFVDEAHDVTEEERNRLRVGRPVRRPAGREFTIELLPLRVPAGWIIDWNTLMEVEPTADAVARGFFGGSSLFQATHIHRRFAIDVEWRPEDDPVGSYHLTVLYAPWERTEKGHRVKSGDLRFDWNQPYHEFRTSSRPELVQELEEWLRRCAERVVEGS